jgi:glycosyltransferase involved in cell wall biosynthesis
MVQTIHNFRLLCPNALFYTCGQVCERCKRGRTIHAVRWRCFRDSYALSALYAFTIGMHRWAGTFAGINHFIAGSAFSAAKLIEGGVAPRERISVLGNFLPDPLPAAGSFRDRSPYVVFLGRLSPEKGVATLVEAAAQAPEVAVKILGDGPDAARCRGLAQSRRATNVDFLGSVTEDAKWDILRNAVAMVVPSVCYENLPFSLLEGMAAGTPIVASRLGSLATLVEEGKNGLLFSAGDSFDLADKLRRLWGDRAWALAMGQRARQFLESHWSASAHYAGLLKVYDLVRTSRGTRPNP